MNMHAAETTLRGAVGAPEPATWIDAAGSRLAVMRRGKGPAVICLHAIGHGARDFVPLAERIGDRFEIIALDWPGQGRSPADGGAPDPLHYAKLVLGAMDALGIERAILLGNSIGGATALRFAAGHPERVKALILCNSGGLAELTPFVRFLIKRFADFFRAGENGKAWYGRAFGIYYSAVLKRAPEQRARIVASAYEIAGVLRAAWEGFAKPQADIRSLAPKVACPVWIAWAKDDQIIAWSRCKAVAQNFSNVKVEMFEGGHAAFLEDPDNFARGFLVFADGL
jgi:4,5:9,10-diseco-3-hydroxy-5,9,17-trioxoandrosta-1(10),2-diene-4-oate hydrolase